MIKIANFDSVLEIAFGLNALFWYFDLVPHTRSGLRELTEKYEQAISEGKGDGRRWLRGVSGRIDDFRVSLQKAIDGKDNSDNVTDSYWVFWFMPKLAAEMPEMSARVIWAYCYSFRFGIPCIAIKICKNPIRWLEAAISVSAGLKMRCVTPLLKMQMTGWARR